MGSLLATYGWYIVFSCILLYVVFQKLSNRLRALRQRQQDRAAATVGQYLLPDKGSGFTPVSLRV